MQHPQAPCLPCSVPDIVSIVAHLHWLGRYDVTPMHVQEFSKIQHCPVFTVSCAYIVRCIWANRQESNINAEETKHASFNFGL